MLKGYIDWSVDKQFGEVTAYGYGECYRGKVEKPLSRIGAPSYDGAIRSDKGEVLEIGVGSFKDQFFVKVRSDRANDRKLDFAGPGFGKIMYADGTVSESLLKDSS